VSLDCDSLGGFLDTRDLANKIHPTHAIIDRLIRTSIQNVDSSHGGLRKSSAVRMRSLIHVMGIRDRLKDIDF
jgi:hypothetical protein